MSVKGGKGVSPIKKLKCFSIIKRRQPERKKQRKEKK